MSIASAPRRFRAGAQAYVVWSVIFGGMTIAGAWAAQTRNATFWESVAVFGGVWVLAIVWLVVFEIRITNDELMFRALFGGTKCIRHSNIRKISLRFDLSGWGGPLRLWVHPKDSKMKKFSINAKVFNEEAIRAVLDLGKRVAVAEPDELEDGVMLRTLRGRTSRKN